MSRNKQTKGMTLLELIISISLLGIVTLAAGNLLAYSAKTGAKAAARQDVLESGRISLDFLLNQTRIASKYKLTPYSGTNMLRQLDLYINNRSGEHVYIFIYDHLTKQLNFGGSGNNPAIIGTNELASGISAVTAVINEDKQIIYFTVTADVQTEEPLSVSGEVSVRFKERLK